MGRALLEQPAELVVSVEEAQAQVRSRSPREESYLAALIAAAVARAEAYCRRRFVSQKWLATLPSWPAGAIALPFPPLISVESVKYLDTDGVLQTLAGTEYTVRTATTPGEIVRAYGVSWPDLREDPDAVRVEFTCGYGDAAAVPAPIRLAVLQLVGTFYGNRESVVTGTIATELPQSAKWLLDPYRFLRWTY